VAATNGGLTLNNGTLDFGNLEGIINTVNTASTSPAPSSRHGA